MYIIAGKVLSRVQQTSDDMRIQRVIFPGICMVIYLSNVTGFSKNNSQHETIMIRSFYKVKPRSVIISSYRHRGSEKFLVLGR